MKRFWFITPLLLFVGMPLLAYAQASGLVPCGAPSFTSYFDANYYLSATGCNFCYLAQLVQNIVNFLIMVAIPISVAMFAWAGVMFFTSAGNPKNIARAKKIFSSVFIGFCIALSGWLLVQVVLQAITNNAFYSGNNWANLDCRTYNGDGGASSPRPRNLSINQMLGVISVTPGGTGGGTGGGGGGGGGGGTVDGNAINRAISNVEVSAACTNSGVDCSLMQAVCVAESGCTTQTSCNSAGACGMMQVTPDTACASGANISGCSGGRVTDLAAVTAALSDNATSANVAAKVLSSGLQACNGDLTCTMAYYNGGPGAVGPSACCSTGAAYQCNYDCGAVGAHVLSCDTNPVPQCKQNTGYAETRDYVTKVQAAQGAIKAKAPGANI